MAKQTVHLKIQRQDGPSLASYWQEFKVPYQPGMNIITCLNEIRKNPVTVGGQRVAPVSWECSCLEEVCGSCSMRINGKPQQSCSALVEDFTEPISLQPMAKFPVIRDLIIDRERMFEALKRVKAWVPIDGTHDLGQGPKQTPQEQTWMYVISRCMTCGCCLEACPQINARSEFIGAAPIAQARLFNAHPTGKSIAGERLSALMEPGGIMDCGNAQNCVQVCPKEIPLTQSISDMGKQTIFFGFKRFFTKADVEM